MTDSDVLRRATVAMKKAATLPVGSVEREIQWAVFDGYMAELHQRAIRHVLRNLGRDDLLGEFGATD